MKKILTVLFIHILGVLFISPIFASVQPKREHRSVWISPFVSDWPSGPITEANAQTHKRICIAMLDSLQVNNFTTVYYHVRAECDATYDSKYEPWSHRVSANRGEAPAFDPLKYILEEGHKRGIEVYAWMNPYRYRNHNATWTECENDYINTHPEWLLSNATQAVLNPAIPDVERRILDVTKDIITKYDVDGVVFDDYFYPAGGMKNEYANADATWYNAYVTGGGKMTLADWRRENVNRMVRSVNAMIKETKPWVRFGISPAGVAGTANTSAPKYGVKPSPGGDWQYDQIYSDPLAWMSEGSIDFISPQIYWPIGGANDFGLLAEWWSYIAKYFGRHLYISQIIPAAKDLPSFDEYTSEIDLTRNYCEDASPGTVYFSWANLRGAGKTIDRKYVSLFRYLRANSFSNKAITPAITWHPVPTQGLPENISYESGVLSWSGIENMRYVVYAVPETEDVSKFNKEAEYIVGISYDPSFEIPKEKRVGFKYAVAYLDRYGNEYSANFVGAELKDAPKAILTAPANGASISDLFLFSWNCDAQQYIVEIAEDRAMTKMVANLRTENNVAPSTDFPEFSKGTYYWRVVSQSSNCRNAYSDVHSLSISPICIVKPANSQEIGLTPSIVLNEYPDGASYTFEFAKDNAMENIVFSETTSAEQYTVPQYRLSGNTQYYVRVKVALGEISKYSNIVSCITLDVTPSKPILKIVDGATLYSNTRISVEPEAGIQSTRVEISATNTFPVRSSYFVNLRNFVFDSAELGNVKISGATLKDGATYYLRTRFDYTLSSSTSLLYTDFTGPISFIYNSSVGVEGIVADRSVYVAGDLLVISNAIGNEEIMIYSTSGAMVDISQCGNLQNGRNEISLSAIPSGVYIVKVKNSISEKILKFVK